MPASLKSEFERGYQILQKNNRYMAEHYDDLAKKHGDKVVVICDGEFLFSAETTKDALDKLREKKIDMDTVLIEYVPKPGKIILF